jgi:hypothetical protein
VWYTVLSETEKMLWAPYGHGLFLFGFISKQSCDVDAMICSELDHGQTLTKVINLFIGTSLKYFRDLIARLLMCFVCTISKVGYCTQLFGIVLCNTIRSFQELAKRLCARTCTHVPEKSQFPLFLEHKDS